MEMQPLDTLSLSKDYKAGGFTQQQAETQAKMLITVVNSNLATKQDMEELRRDTKVEIASVRRDIKELEYRIKIFTGGMAFALFTTLVAVMSAFKFLV